MAKQISAAERMAYFNQSTRQNIHMLPTVSGGASSTMQMLLPKSRLLSKLMIKAEVTIKNKSTLAQGNIYINPHRAIRRISLDLNNGFSPFTISGEELYLYNLMSVNADGYKRINSPNSDYGAYNPILAVENSTTPGTEKENKYEVYYELPLTLNERDASGLVLLQNAETNVTLSIDVGNGFDMAVDEQGSPSSTSTVEVQNAKVMAATMTFSLPAIQEAFPDLSVLKLVNGVSHAFLGNGVNTIKLSTGTIYRKLILKFEDENGFPMLPTDFTSDIQLVFNQADINYSIDAGMLKNINTMALNRPMPDGCYFLDFSSQGFTNYGGTRDLIDTELLTEFWLKFGTNTKGRVEVISECIARVK